MPRLTIDFHGFCVYPNNVPMRRPGVYKFTRRGTSRSYIGLSTDVYFRTRYHSASPSSTRRFSRALAKYGRSAFVLEPLFYLIADEVEWLLYYECLFIVENDTIRKGYNATLSFRALMRQYKEDHHLVAQALANPALQKAMAAADTYSPRTREQQAASMRAYYKEHPEAATAKSEMWKALWADPEVAAKLRTLRADPDYEANRRAKIKAGMVTPEAQAKTNAFLADPVKQARRGKAVKAGLAQSDKWAAEQARRKSPAARAANAARGRAQFATEEARQAASARQAAIAGKHREALLRAHANCPRHWITDGATTRKTPVADPIPSGWHKGRAAV